MSGRVGSPTLPGTSEPAKGFVRPARSAAGRSPVAVGLLRRDRLSLALFWLIALATALFLLWAGHGLSFRHDEWDIIQSRASGGIHNLLEPLNEHLSLVPLSLYYVLLHTVGLAHYPAYRTVLIAFHVCSALLVFLLVRRRLDPALALLAAVVTLIFGAAYEDMLFPVQIGQVGSILGGLLAWLSLDVRGRRGDFALLAALTLAVCSSGLGLAVLAGVAVEVLWSKRWTHLAVVGVVLGAYLVWYARYGQSATHGDLSRIPSFLAGIVAYTVVGTVGLWPLYHLPAAGLMVVTVLLCAGLIVAVVIARRHGLLALDDAADVDAGREGPDQARLAGLVATAGAFWVLTAIARSGLSPYRSRYAHLGGIVVILIAAELLRGRRLPPRLSVLAAVAGTAFALINLPYIAHNAVKYRDDSAVLDAELAAVQLRSSTVPPGLHPDPSRDPQVAAGPYLRAVDALHSSPADEPAQIAMASPFARTAADAVLVRIAEPLRIVSVRAAGRDCRPAATSEDRIASMSGIAIPPDGTVIVNRSAAAVQVGLRRFGDRPVWLPAPVPAGMAAGVVPGSDRLSVGWHLSVSRGTGVSVCAR